MRDRLVNFLPLSSAGAALYKELRNPSDSICFIRTHPGWSVILNRVSDYLQVHGLPIVDVSKNNKTAS